MGLPSTTAVDGGATRATEWSSFESIHCQNSPSTAFCLVSIAVSSLLGDRAAKSTCRVVLGFGIAASKLHKRKDKTWLSLIFLVYLRATLMLRHVFNSASYFRLLSSSYHWKKVPSLFKIVVILTRVCVIVNASTSFVSPHQCARALTYSGRK